MATANTNIVPQRPQKYIVFKSKKYTEDNLKISNHIHDAAKFQTMNPSVKSDISKRLLRLQESISKKQLPNIYFSDQKVKYVYMPAYKRNKSIEALEAY